MSYIKIKEDVNSFKTKHPQGFLQEEIKELLKNYPDINMDKFNDALTGITCMMIDEKIIIYHCDIEVALRCGIENRNPTLGEWD